MCSTDTPPGGGHIPLFTEERATAMTTNVMFNRDAIEAEIVQLQALVSAIKEQRGSASKRLRDAIDQALTEDVEFDATDAGFPQLNWEAFEDSGDRVHVQGPLVEIATYVESINEWADQLRDEAVSLILKDQASVNNLDALKEQYHAKRTMVEAMITLCKAQKIDVDGLAVPAIGGGRPAGSKNSNTPRKPGSKWSRFYRVVNGERKDQSDSQNTLSSFAYYHGAKLMQVDERPSTAALTEYLRKQLGIDSPIGKSWFFTVDDIGYGNEVSDGNNEEE